MSPVRTTTLFVATMTTLTTLACVRTRAVDKTSAPPASTPSEPPTMESAEASADAASEDAGPSSAVVDAAVAAWVPPPAANIDGPHEELSLDAGRPVYYAFPRTPVTNAQPFRLVGHLHGMCGPPVYACGRWIGAGTDVGMMVCPTGNARCGDSPVGPASWEASSWTELVAIMDADLEAAVAKVQAKRPGAIRREGAVLTGYSRGGFAVPLIARRHPNRWPYLVLIEADAPLTKAALEASGVRAVALVAGEYGTERAGMEKTQQDLAREGFSAKLFVMRRTGHPYSDDMEQVMHEALAYVLPNGSDESADSANSRRDASR